MIRVVMELAKSALSLWESKEKTKYYDRLIKLEKEWYEEYNKPTMEEAPDLRPREWRDNAVLDRLDNELLILGKVISTKIGESNS